MSDSPGDKPKKKMPVGRPFEPGKSGNPGGPPKQILTKLRDAYRDDVMAIVGVFRDLALGNPPPDGYGEIKASDRIKAGQEVLDRVLGKAPQQIDGEMNIGISPAQVAVLAAIQLTPHERRQRIAQLDAEDAAAIAEFEAQDQNAPSADPE